MIDVKMKCLEITTYAKTCANVCYSKSPLSKYFIEQMFVVQDKKSLNTSIVM